MKGRKMKIEKASCPYCGAALKIRPGQQNTECEYCGCTVLITDTDEDFRRRRPEQHRNIEQNKPFVQQKNMSQGFQPGPQENMQQGFQPGPQQNMQQGFRPGPQADAGRSVPPAYHYGTSVNGRPAAYSGDARQVVKPEKHSLFPPPGFRQKNILHILVALTGYPVIFLMAKEMDNPVRSIAILLSSLSALDLCTDWTGIFSRLPGIYSSGLLIRFLSKVLWSILVIFLWLVLAAVVEISLGI
jgi:hypothetical protein